MSRDVLFRRTASPTKLVNGCYQGLHGVIVFSGGEDIVEGGVTNDSRHNTLYGCVPLTIFRSVGANVRQLEGTGTYDHIRIAGNP